MKLSIALSLALHVLLGVIILMSLPKHVPSQIQQSISVHFANKIPQQAKSESVERRKPKARSSQSNMSSAQPSSHKPLHTSSPSLPSAEQLELSLGNLKLDSGTPYETTEPESNASIQNYPMQQKGENYIYKSNHFSAIIKPNGNVEFSDQLYSIGTPLTLPGADDLIMKGRGDIWHRYEKQQFLIATEKWRTQHAQENHKQNNKEALAALRSHLEAIWSNASKTLEERKAIIHQLWEEADTKGRIIIEAFLKRADISK